MEKVRTFTSSVLGPADRGVELGEQHREEVARTVAAYRRLFAARATVPFDVDLWAERAWERIKELAPLAAAEIHGIAEGARVPVREVAMLNARTELLAIAYPLGAGECSAVVSLAPDRPAVAVQTWDWYTAMERDWLHWTIPHPGGHVVSTVTEYGVLGKIGISSAGVAVLFNMLRHESDARATSAGLGYPVHLLSRRILDTAADLDEALEIARSVTTSASTSLTVVDADETGGRAATVELFPDGPAVVEPEDGLLVRTNHFVSGAGEPGCRAALVGPSSQLRRTTLLAAFEGAAPATAGDALTAMHDHADVGGVCAHPDPALEPALRHGTLATVVVDTARRRLEVSPGGPCAR